MGGGGGGNTGHGTIYIYIYIEAINTNTIDGSEIPNNHLLDVLQKPVLNNGIQSTINLNW